MADYLTRDEALGLKKGTSGKTNNLRIYLFVRERSTQKYPKESIMQYGKICDHDSGFLCECRLKWLIEYIEKQNLL